MTSHRDEWSPKIEADDLQVKRLRYGLAKKPTQIRLDARDLAHVETIKRVGLAKTTTGAVQYGLWMGARAAKRAMEKPTGRRQSLAGGEREEPPVD